MPPAPPLQVAVLNASTTVTDAEVLAVVDALQQQVNDDFHPVWGVHAIINFTPQGSSPPAGAWTLTILDDSDHPSALGYHLISSDALPYAKVFAGSAMRYGKPWSVIASHELMEMLVDPSTNLTVFVQNGSRTAGTLYAHEVCDPCGPAQFGYSIGGVRVSDFVYPSWFEPFREEGSAQFDHTKYIRRPFQVCPGGYISAFIVSDGAGWQLVR